MDMKNHPKPKTASDSVPPVRTSALTLSSSARSNSRSLFRLSIWRSLSDRKHKVMVCWHRSQAETKYSLLTITGWSEKHPDSPVIEAAVRRSKRLIKYVQLQRKSTTEKLKKLHNITLWQLHDLWSARVPYLRLRLYAGRWDVADLDEGLGVVIVIVLLLWFLLVRDDHHRLHVFGQWGRVQEVRRGLTRGQRKGRYWLNTATLWDHVQVKYLQKKRMKYRLQRKNYHVESQQNAAVCANKKFSPVWQHWQQSLTFKMEAVTQHWSHPTSPHPSVLLHQAVWESGWVSWSTSCLWLYWRRS